LSSQDKRRNEPNKRAKTGQERASKSPKEPKKDENEPKKSGNEPGKEQKRAKQLTDRLIVAHSIPVPDLTDQPPF